jgi:membrane protein
MLARPSAANPPCREACDSRQRRRDSRRGAPRIKRRMKRALRLLIDTFDLWLAKQAFQLAAALAFYTLFSLAPLLIILITITGVFFGEDAAKGEISAQVEQFIGSQAADAVEGAIRRSRIAEAGLLPTLLGIGILLFAATTVFAQMQNSLNQMWDVVAEPSRSGIVVFLVARLLSLGLVLIIGFLLLVMFVISMALAALIRYAEDWIPVPALALSTIDLVFSLVVATALFATIFKVLPDVRLTWGDTWRGAFLTALLFVAGQYLISLYLTQTAPASTYGAAGSLVVILFWVYYSSLILFFGAAFTKVYILWKGGEIVPKAMAVRVRTEVLGGGKS